MHLEIFLTLFKYAITLTDKYPKSSLTFPFHPTQPEQNTNQASQEDQQREAMKSTSTNTYTFKHFFNYRLSIPISFICES